MFERTCWFDSSRGHKTVAIVVDGLFLSNGGVLWGIPTPILRHCLGILNPRRTSLAKVLGSFAHSKTACVLLLLLEVFF